MITTQQQADPKPVTGFDYAGQPMRTADAHYNGRPEHQATADLQQSNQAIHPDQAIHALSDRASQSVRLSPSRNKRWTAEKRAVFAQQMRQIWIRRKANQQQST